MRGQAAGAEHGQRGVPEARARSVHPQGSKSPAGELTWPWPLGSASPCSSITHPKEGDTSSLLAGGSQGAASWLMPCN